MKQANPRVAFLAAALPAVCSLTNTSLAQVPEGFEMVVLRTTTGIPSWPDINDQSQVVWSESFPLPGPSNVFLWTEGKILQITDDAYRDRNPAINNAGVITWNRREEPTGPMNWKLMIWANGTLVPIPGDPPAYAPPDINDLGHIAFTQLLSEKGGQQELFLYNGETVQQISNNALSNQGQSINIHDDIVWTRYDFSVYPWKGTIMMYSEGVTYQLSDGLDQDQAVAINNLRQLVWDDQEGGIVLVEPGDAVGTVITEDGGGPQINNNGAIAFGRYNYERKRFDAWLYKESQFYKLPDFGYSVGGGFINDKGEVVSRGFDYDTGINAILMLRRCDPPDGPSCTDDAQCEDGNPCTEGRCECGHCAYAARLYGDVNDDETVDLADILCVLDAFRGDFSTCAMSSADIGPCTPDGTIDLLDIFSVLDAFAGQDPCCG